MRWQKFKVILNSNERSNLSITICTHTQPMMMLTSSWSNCSSIQLVHGVNWFQFTDSEDLIENYPAGEIYTSNFYFWMPLSLISSEMTSHHGCQLIGWFTSRDINTSYHCWNINLFKDNDNIKPVPKLAKVCREFTIVEMTSHSQVRPVHKIYMLHE